MTAAASHGARHLAYICPNIVLPSMMDKIYPALQTVTETHQTVAALSVLLNIVRPLLWRENYEHGGKHLSSILQLCLPGIDPNDASKTQHALAVYMTVLANVNIVDCSASPLPNDVSDEDREMYASTGFFEDWAIQFLDRVFCVLETLVAASSKIHSTERGLGHVLAVACEDFFEQLSAPLYQRATRKLHQWIMSNRLVHVGKTAGLICAGAVRANPKFALQLFLPEIGERVKVLFESYKTVDETDVDAEDTVDHELLWFLHILVRLVKFGGTALIEYRELLIDIFDHGLRMVPYKAAKLVGKIFRQTLKSLVTLYPLDTRSLTPSQLKEANNDPVKLFNMRGVTTGPKEDLEVQWHIVSAEELEFAEELTARYFEPAVKNLKRLTLDASMDTAADTSADSGRAPYSKAVVRADLLVVRNVIRVGLPLAPEFSADDGNITRPGDGKVVLRLPDLVIVPDNAALVAGIAEGRRQTTCDLMHSLVGFFLTQMEDDTKAMQMIIKIIKQLLCVRGVPERKYSYSMRSYDMVKRQYEDVVRGNKLHTRGLLITRVLLQHSRRMSKRRISSPFHEMYRTLISDLVLLGTSRYAKVRQQAQTTLFSSMAVFSQAKQGVIPKVMDLLSVPADEMEAKHQQLKGALHILAHRSVSKAINSDFTFIQMFIETVPLLHCNNKPSIQDMVSRAFSSLRQEFRTRNLELKLPEVCFQSAHHFCAAIDGKQDYFRTDALQQSKAHDSELASKFDVLVEQLISTLVNDAHNWRFELMLAGILLALLRDDRKIPRSVIVYFFRNLSHDMIHIRTQASRASNVIIAMCKTRPLKKQLLLHTSSDATPNVLTFVDDAPPSSESAETGDADILLAKRSCREQGHVFKAAQGARPTTKEDFEKATFVDKNYIGWNGWPENMLTYPPAQSQAETPVPFCNPWIEEILDEDGFIHQWIEYASQSKADGSALGFSDCRAELFKGLARNHGMKVFGYFKAEVIQLLEICETDGTGERASKQRCAAEIVAGVVRGAKHWPYDGYQVLWDWVVPLLEKHLGEVTNLNIHDWSCAIRFCVYDRDPRRFYRLTDVLFTSSLTMSEDDTAFAQHRKLYFLHTALEELSWRGQEPGADLLKDLTPFMSHPYKLVREKIARCLFVALRAFWNPYQSKEAEKVNNDLADANSPIRGFVTQMAASFASTKSGGQLTDPTTKKHMTNCYKTVLIWISTTFHDGSSAALIPHLHILLPQLFSIPEMNPDDDELAGLCQTALGHASQAVLPSGHMEAYLNGTLEATHDKSWHARRRALVFIQVLAFRNLYLIPRQKVVEAVIRLVSDEQLEVRELASVTLSGMIRCGIAPTGLKDKFVAMAKTKIRKVRRQKKGKGESASPKPLTVEEKTALIHRHAGILGLQALITAFPYTIPEWMPSALVLVSGCINDPEPVKASVTKTLSEFWRTHQDDKQAIKDAFTEDEYDILKDLVIGYNYYA